MNRLIATTTLATLLSVGTAFAQTAPAQTAPGRTAPGQTAPMNPSDRAPADKMAPGARAANPSMSTSSMAARAEMRASKLMGATVVNAANENIGEVNEILLSNDGRVAQVVVGVGGFLGIGERNVAVPFEQLTIRHDGDDLKITSSFTKDTLTNMPAWTWRAPAAGAPGSTTAPAR